MSEAINGTEEVPALNTQNATVGNAFTEVQIRQFPLQARNVVELLSLQPGVSLASEVMGAKRDQHNVTLRHTLMLRGTLADNSRDEVLAQFPVGIRPPKSWTIPKNWPLTTRPCCTGTCGIIRGPGMTNFDLSLGKFFTLPFEGHRIQVRAEAFNVFNNVNFTTASLSLANPSTFGPFINVMAPRVMKFALRYEF